MLLASPSAAGSFETMSEEEVATYLLFGLDRHAPAPPGLLTFSPAAKPLTVAIAMVEGSQRAEIGRITVERTGACSFRAELSDTGALAVFRVGTFSVDFTALETVEADKTDDGAVTIFAGAKMRCLASQFDGACDRFNSKDGPRVLWRWRIGPMEKDKSGNVQTDRARLKEAVAHMKGKVCVQ